MEVIHVHTHTHREDYLMPSPAPTVGGARRLLVVVHVFIHGGGVWGLLLCHTASRDPPALISSLQPTIPFLLALLIPLAVLLVRLKALGPDPPQLHWGRSQLACTGVGHRQVAATATSCLGEGVGLVRVMWEAWTTSSSRHGFPEHSALASSLPLLQELAGSRPILEHSGRGLRKHF